MAKFDLLKARQESIDEQQTAVYLKELDNTHGLTAKKQKSKSPIQTGKPKLPSEPIKEEDLTELPPNLHPEKVRLE